MEDIGRAHAKAMAGDIDQARDAITQFHPDDPSLSLRDQAIIAQIWLKSGDSTSARQWLNRNWADASPDVAGLAGALCLGLGDFERAILLLFVAVRGETIDPVAHRINYGRALMLAGRPEEALEWLMLGASAEGEARSLGLRSLAEALLMLGRVDEALAALPADDPDLRMIEARVIVLCMAGRHAEATVAVNAALTAHSDEPGLVLLAADIARIQGRDGQAIAVLQEALARDPDNLRLCVRLAQSGRGVGSHPLQRAAAERAVEIAGSGDAADQAAALTARAFVENAEGDTAKAKATYREALDLHGGNISALMGLGHVLLEAGQIDEAVACFEQVRAAAPLEGWSSLIAARKVPDDPQVFEDLERAARMPSMEGPLRSSLLLTVASAWDRKKNYDRAMTLAAEANAAQKALLSYDPAKHRDHVERIMSVFSAEFFASRAGWGDGSRLPVFVVGMPRSGTTLTEQILAGHSRVFGAGELGEVGQQINRMELWELKAGSGRCYPECVFDMTDEDSKGYARLQLEALQRFDPSASHIVDKLPHNFENVGLIKLLFPNATIFHCRREPRDIATSNFITDYAAKFGGMGFAYDLRWIGEQLVDHDRLMAHWHALFPGQIMEVCYENLVEDTEGWARQMIAHLGLEWEPGVLNFQEVERAVKTASMWQVRQPVYTTSKERWRNYDAHLGPLEEALAVVPPMPEPFPLPDVPPGAFTAAVEMIRAGRLSEGAPLLEAVLRGNPDHAAANHFYGVALCQTGRREAGLSHVRRSVELQPANPQWRKNLSILEAT